ncbi:MAG: hypothetical protein PHR53_09530 [Bacteroidales bacterium]|nr:hypothetical protein [Bacteroidales bacterium]
MNETKNKSDEIEEPVVPKRPTYELNGGCGVCALLFLSSPIFALGYYSTMQVGLWKTLLAFTIGIFLTPFIFLIPWFLYKSQKQYYIDCVKDGILEAEKAKRQKHTH